MDMKKIYVYRDKKSKANYKWRKGEQSYHRMSLEKSKQGFKTFRLRKMYIKDPLYDNGNTMQKY